MAAHRGVGDGERGERGAQIAPVLRGFERDIVGDGLRARAFSQGAVARGVQAGVRGTEVPDQLLGRKAEISALAGTRAFDQIARIVTETARDDVLLGQVRVDVRTQRRACLVAGAFASRAVASASPVPGLR